jgi:hypothetical protein
MASIVASSFVAVENGLFTRLLILKLLGLWIDD